jgi:putative ABC transport system permease protein
LLGVINTLLLSVYERTRELGLLRAVGATQAQIRSMIRGEAVIIAVLGCVVGLGVGLLWSWAFISALNGSGIRSMHVPWVQLGSYVVLSAAAGVLASLVPAWRAGRLNVLRAIAAN